MRILLVFAACLILAACGNKSDDAGGGDKTGGGDEAEVARPTNGSPVGATFVKFIDGRDGRGVQARLHNFGDKPAAGYVILARYYDDQGALLKVKPGTAFEEDHDFTSLSGNKYRCDPGKDCTLDIEMLSAPEAATRAELVISKVDTADGMKIENWWQQEGGWSEWPADGEPAAGEPTEPAAGEPTEPAAGEPAAPPAE
jgi:hypothetical protein